MKRTVSHGSDVTSTGGIQAAHLCEYLIVACQEDRYSFQKESFFVSFDI